MISIGDQCCDEKCDHRLWSSVGVRNCNGMMLMGSVYSRYLADQEYIWVWGSKV